MAGTGIKRETQHDRSVGNCTGTSVRACGHLYLCVAISDPHEAQLVSAATSGASVRVRNSLPVSAPSISRELESHTVDSAVVASVVGLVYRIKLVYSADITWANGSVFFCT